MSDLVKYNSKILAKFLESGANFSSISFSLEEFDLKELFYIREVTVHCENCEAQKPFHNIYNLLVERNHFQSYLGNRDDFFELINGQTRLIEFKCITCETSHQSYLLDYKIKNEEVTFTKSGESPRHKKPQNKILQKFFKKDSENFRKAMNCFDNGYGVAAFAYLRRIIEGNIILLLKTVEKSIDEHDKAMYKSEISSIKEAFDSLKPNSPMSSKIKVANFNLPKYLNPEGENPFGRLYGILSEGVHSLSDEECMNIAEEVLECLTYLIKSITEHNQNRNEYLDKIRKLDKKKANKK